MRSTSAVERAQRSSDGSTVKLLVRLQDGLQVEAVVMTYERGGPEGASAGLGHCYASCCDIHARLRSQHHPKSACHAGNRARC